MENEKVMINPTFQWCTDGSLVPELTQFFCSQIDTDYISHGEIQIGRALNQNEWAPDLADVVSEEISGLIEGTIKQGAWPRVAEGRVEGQLVALAIINVKTDAPTPFAVYEDVVVHREFRGNGLGKALISWLDSEVKNQGCTEIFIESGLRNLRAHEFFHGVGFVTCSVSMVKTL